MKTIVKKFVLVQSKIENWFNKRFGWFFTNGNKEDYYSNQHLHFSKSEEGLEK